MSDEDVLIEDESKCDYQTTALKGTTVPPNKEEYNNNYLNSNGSFNDEENKSEFNSGYDMTDPDFKFSHSDSSQTQHTLQNDTIASFCSSESPKPSRFKPDSQEERKRKRNLGLPYMTANGLRPARKFRVLANNCAKKCSDKVSAPEQKQIFEKYWALGCYSKRIQFIAALLQVDETKTKTKFRHPQNPRARPYHIKYALQLGDQRFETCQKCFRQVFDETDGFLKSVVRKKMAAKRGKIENVHVYAKRTKRKPCQITHQVQSHILSFPLYQYHHAASQTTFRYFHADLTLKKMFDLYLDLYPTTEISFAKYVEIFESLEIKFKKPSKDSCCRCELLKTDIDVARAAGLSSLEALEDELRQHKETVDLSFTSKRRDKLLSMSDTSVKTFAFALQKCLSTPLLHAPESYCKRLLWTFNLTVHDCIDGNPHCFMWHEGVARRSGNQIASCILKHLSLLDASDAHLHHAIFYSTKLLGQKTNSTMVAMFRVFLQSSSHIRVIDHKFLETGHSHTECDVDHALIERKRKKCKAKIHHPRDWYNFARFVGMKHNLKVVEMMDSDFRDFGTFAKGKILRGGTNQGCATFDWNKVKWLRYDKNSIGYLQYKCSLTEEEPFDTIVLQKGKFKSMLLDKSLIVGDKVCISLQKKSDLISLLPLIDPEFHDFYKNLPAENRLDTHPDLFDGFDEADH